MTMSAQPSFLPSDEVIFERSKVWANFMSRMEQKEDFCELSFADIPSGDEDNESESEVDENQTDINGVVVKSNNFEGSSSSDDFDVDNLLNETLPVIEERKRKWKESGMDRVLDTFDLDAITNKVGSWLRKARMDKCMAPNLSIGDEQIIRFENHRIQFDSDDSLQSTDTAKYILSNRRPRAASCTTMTIKRFRYGKGKQEELQRKSMKMQSRTMFRVMSENPEIRKAAVCSRKCEHSLNASFPKVVAKTRQEAIGRQRGRNKKRRSEVLRKRSESSSSCCSASNGSYSRPKFRRFSRKLRNGGGENSEQILNSTMSCESSPKKDVSPAKAQLNPPLAIHEQVKTAQSSNVTCFVPENIVNSTALSNAKRGPVKARICELSPIVNRTRNTLNSRPTIRLRRSIVDEGSASKSQESEKLPEQQKQKVENSVVSEVQDSDRKVIVYTPERQDLYRENISNGCFKLTKEHLRKSVGKKAARRFITFNERKFPIKFDTSSTVYFKFAAESENSHGTESDVSDEDVLSMFGKEGELIVQPSKTP